MLTKVLPLVIYQKILRKNTTKALTLKINNDVPGSNIELVLSGAATIENGRLLKSSCREILDQLAVSPSISINCSKMDYIDSSALGTLMLLKANIKRRGGDFGLFGTSPRINRLMRLHGVEEFLLEQ
jgi:anti-anti-sigma factor